MYTVDEAGNTWHLVKVDRGSHNGSASRHKRETRAFCRYSIETYGYVSHWVFGTDFLGREGLDRLKLAVSKLQRRLNKLGVAYIMVFEEGEKSEHWHIHTLLDKFIEIEKVRELWVSATGIENAHINVTTMKPDENERSSNARLANYINKSIGKLSKYVNKASSKYPGERLFRKSNSVSPLIKDYIDVLIDKPTAFVGFQCCNIDPFDDAVKVIAQMSGYDEAEIRRRLLDD